MCIRDRSSPSRQADSSLAPQDPPATRQGGDEKGQEKPEPADISGTNDSGLILDIETDIGTTETVVIRHLADVEDTLMLFDRKYGLSAASRHALREYLMRYV